MQKRPTDVRILPLYRPFGESLMHLAVMSKHRRFDGVLWNRFLESDAELFWSCAEDLLEDRCLLGYFRDAYGMTKAAEAAGFRSLEAFDGGGYRVMVRESEG
jgi:hypothetical protein